MTTVLITAMGGDIAQSVARLVRRSFPELRLIGTDMSTEHGGALFVEEMRVVPPASSAYYLDTLISLIETERVDYVLPMAEAEMKALLPLIEGRAHAHWICAGARVIRAGIDKLETMRAIERMGIAVPWTVVAGANDPPTFPCILKDRYGSGSRNVHIVHNREEARYLAARQPDAIYQELLPGADREVTCAVYRTLDGRVATLQMRRRLVGGLTGWAVVIDDDAVTGMCERIATQLDLTGAMNVQLRLTAEGPRIFEINPRYSSTALMRDAIGFTDVVWAFDELHGRPVTFPRVPPGTVVVRTQDAAVLRSRNP